MCANTQQSKEENKRETLPMNFCLFINLDREYLGMSGAIPGAGGQSSEQKQIPALVHELPCWCREADNTEVHKEVISINDTHCEEN